MEILFWEPKKGPEIDENECLLAEAGDAETSG